jgi:hypothetical protein
VTTSPVMNLITNGIPITLLCDLASLADPDSEAINSVERPASDPLWLEAAQTLIQRQHATSA